MDKAEPFYNKLVTGKDGKKSLHNGVSLEFIYINDDKGVVPLNFLQLITVTGQDPQPPNSIDADKHDDGSTKDLLFLNPTQAAMLIRPSRAWFIDEPSNDVGVGRDFKAQTTLLGIKGGVIFAIFSLDWGYIQDEGTGEIHLSAPIITPTSKETKNYIYMLNWFTKHGIQIH